MMSRSDFFEAVHLYEKLQAVEELERKCYDLTNIEIHGIQIGSCDGESVGHMSSVLNEKIRDLMAWYKVELRKQLSDIGVSIDE
jgi:hypothetical protein